MRSEGTAPKPQDALQGPASDRHASPAPHTATVAKSYLTLTASRRPQPRNNLKFRTLAESSLAIIS